MAALQFWKPGTVGPGSTLDRATETEGVIVPSGPSSSSLGIQSQRERLPIFKHSSWDISVMRIIGSQCHRREATILYRKIWRCYCTCPNWGWKNYSYAGLIYREVVRASDVLQKSLNTFTKLVGQLGGTLLLVPSRAV